MAMKKGIFFTLSALLIVSVISFIVLTELAPGEEQVRRAKHLNVRILNDYIGTLESEIMPRVLFASTQKALTVAARDIQETGSFLQEGDLAELVENGMLRGDESDAMQGQTLRSWLESITQTTREHYDAEITLQVDDLRITQNRTPWSIDVEMEVSYQLEGDLASWNRDTTIETSFSIEGRPDPYYMALSGENRTVRRLPRSFDDDLSPQNLSLIRDSGYYLADVESPSYLQRFFGQPADDESPCCGVFSLVNATTPEYKTSVDHQFWSGNCETESRYQVGAVSSMFLDGHYVSRFGLDADEVDQDDLSGDTVCGD